MLRPISRFFAYRLPGEIISVEVKSEVKGLVIPSEVYKPLQKIEFDTKGETLVYSANPAQHQSVFFPVPWSLGTWSVPFLIFQIQSGNLAFSLPLAIGMYAAIMPHAYYLYNLRFAIDKIWYLRGGFWKIQNTGPYGMYTMATTEPANLKIVKGRAELDENGSLSEGIVMKAEDWTEVQENITDQRLEILKEGKVHNPEIFLAMLQGLKIDDSNFVINKDPDNSMISGKCIGK